MLVGFDKLKLFGGLLPYTAGRGSEPACKPRLSSKSSSTSSGASPEATVAPKNPCVYHRMGTQVVNAKLVQITIITTVYDTYNFITYNL